MTLKNKTYRNVTITSLVAVIMITSGIGIVYASDDSEEHNDSTTTATGHDSTAFGKSTNASGDRSAAFGYSTTASDWNSAAFGRLTKASGENSAAFGDKTIASGWNSAAFGDVTEAQPYDSFVIGRYNEVSGSKTSWIDTEPLFVIGNGDNISNLNNAVTVLKNGNVGIGTSSPTELLHVKGDQMPLVTFESSTGHGIEIHGWNSGANINPVTTNDNIYIGKDVTLGNLIIHSGNVGIGTATPSAPLQVIGNAILGASSNIANGTNSVAFGDNTLASGNKAVSFGTDTTASDINSAAFGRDTEASGKRSVAFGDLSKATALNSAAFGFNNTASGSQTAAFGAFSNAQSLTSFVVGRCNEVSGDPDSWVDTDPLFVIGNGDYSSGCTRNNAVTVLKNGNVGIGISSPDRDLHIYSENDYAGIKLEAKQTTDDASIQFTQNGADKASIGYDDSDDVAKLFYGSFGSNKGIVVNSVGNVGIGISSPSSLLEIASSGTILGLSVTNTGTGDSFRVNDEASDTTPFVINSAGKVGIGKSSPDEMLHVVGDTKLDGDTLVTGDSIFDSKVGIGTSSPANLLSIEGDATPQFTITDTTNSVTGFMRATDVHVIIGSDSESDLKFNTNNVERMRIDSTTGNVGIGLNNPNSKLKVVGYIQLDTSSGTPASADCDAPNEVGRMKMDSANNNLYVCSTNGWQTK